MTTSKTATALSGRATARATASRDAWMPAGLAEELRRLRFDRPRAGRFGRVQPGLAITMTAPRQLTSGGHAAVRCSLRTRAASQPQPNRLNKNTRWRCSCTKTRVARSPQRFNRLTEKG